MATRTVTEYEPPSNAVLTIEAWRFQLVPEPVNDSASQDGTVVPGGYPATTKAASEWLTVTWIDCDAGSGPLPSAEKLSEVLSSVSPSPPLLLPQPAKATSASEAANRAVRSDMFPLPRNHHLLRSEDKTNWFHAAKPASAAVQGVRRVYDGRRPPPAARARLRHGTADARSPFVATPRSATAIGIRCQMPRCAANGSNGPYAIARPQFLHLARTVTPGLVGTSPPRLLPPP